MSDSHKAALAEGREQGRAVGRYSLKPSRDTDPKRGRKRTTESVQRRLTAIDEKVNDVDALTRLHLVQEKMNLEAQLASTDNAVDLGSLEDGFVAAAAPYGHRKGTTYSRHGVRRRRPGSAPQGGNQAGRRVAPEEDVRAGDVAAGVIPPLTTMDASSGRPSSEPRESVARPLRVRHQAHHVPSGGTYTGDCVDRAVRVSEIAQDDAVFGVQFGQHVGGTCSYPRSG